MFTSTKIAPAAALVGLLVITPSAFAEIFRCEDAATGKVTFTDVACPDKGAGNYVPVGPANSDEGYPSGAERSMRQYQQAGESSAQKWVDKANAIVRHQDAEKRQRKSDRLYREAEFTKNPWERAAIFRQARELEGLSPRQASPIPMRASPIPMPAPQPSVITNCDPAGCWDNVGNRYNKGAGETYFRTDGKTCQGVGGNMQCN